KPSHGRTTKAPPDERGGNRYVRPTATAPHPDSTNKRSRPTSAARLLRPQERNPYWTSPDVGVVPIGDIGRLLLIRGLVASTLYAARGRLMPFNSNSPTGSTFTTFSTFVSTRGLIRICPGLASSQRREATLDTVPMAA